MAEEKYLKDINRKYLIAYMLLNYLLFGWFSGSLVFSLEEWQNLFQKISNPAHILGLLIIPLCIILEAIISSDHKYKLVFLRLENPLPGCRAFTEIAPKDPRIDMNRLTKLFPSGIPQDPNEQNSVWYSLYKKNSNKLIIVQAHQAFLLARDLAAMTFLFLPASLVAELIWLTPGEKILLHLAVLFLILIGTIIAGQNYGERLVANAIVEELNSTGEQK